MVLSILGKIVYDDTLVLHTIEQSGDNISSKNNKSKFKCEECGKEFARKDSLQRHKKSIHLKVKFECPHCDYSAARNDYLKRHINSIHLNLRKYVCEICGEGFNQSGTLNRHILTIHEKRKPYECTQCNTVFSRKDQLLRHTQTVHENIRNHICNECRATFQLSHHLKDHITSMHTDKRQHICEECGFAFKLRTHLIDHVKVVHQGLRPYACEECDSSFPHARNLKQHIISVHTDDLPYVCKKCKRGFADPSHLYRHEQAEACWFTTTTAYKWEELCKEIAEVLLEGKNWEWKPTIETPELVEQTRVQPEIVIYNDDGTMDFIDAKRSTYAIFKEKDLVVYPKVARRVEFWCLYGKTEGMFEEEEGVEVISSSEIIEELEKKRTKEDVISVDSLIMKISMLKKGLDFDGQIVLTKYTEEINEIT
ncbi:MAG: C2H2-type zinc finger protein [Candidatus Heimdallarchaeota archaeon]|nr:C2H2-type zinc finger protein [Candidatus Heimdallarchaeota archaeon]